MKEHRSTRRIRTAAVVALGAITVLALAVTPALADPGTFDVGDNAVIGVADLAVDAQLITEIDWDMVEAIIQEQPEATDGDTGVQEPEQTVPGDGENEGGEEPEVPGDGTDQPGEQTVPGDGTDQPGEQPSTPEQPAEPEKPEQGTPPSLPFTGGNGGRFAVAGIFVLMAGMLVLARGYALHRS